MRVYVDLKTNRRYQSPLPYFLFKAKDGFEINRDLYYIEVEESFGYINDSILSDVVAAAIKKNAVSGENVIAYSPYHRFTALLEKEELEYLQTHEILDSDAPKDLRAGNFYISPDKNVSKYFLLEKPYFKPTELTVFLGDVCNLACVYCNAVNARDGDTFNPDLTIKAVEAMLKTYPIKHISFFGNGEPLLYFDTIKRIVKLAKTHGIKSFYVVTNGVLGPRRKEVVRFLVENKFQVQISIDGYPEIHDAQRPFPDGRGSINEVLKTINEFKKYGDINKYAFARFTLSELAAENIIKIVCYLYKLGFRRIRFAELVVEGRADGRSSITRPPKPETITNKVLLALLLAEVLGIDIKGDYDPREPSADGAFPCPYMAGKAVSLNKNLRLLACLEDYPMWQIGYVDVSEHPFIKVNSAWLATLQQRNMHNFDKCVTCPVKCGGGCTHYSYLTSKNLTTPGDRPGKCEALQKILAGYLLLKLIGGYDARLRKLCDSVIRGN